MSRVAALGAPRQLAGFALAGVTVLPADTDDDVRRVWRTLDPEVSVIILTSAARQALGGLLDERSEVMWATLLD